MAAASGSAPPVPQEHEATDAPPATPLPFLVRWAQALEQWLDIGLQGALGLSTSQLAATDVWLLQQRMQTFGSPESPSADSDGTPPTFPPPSRADEAPNLLVPIEAPDALKAPSQLFKGSAEDDIFWVAGDTLQVQSGAGADLLLLAARQVTLLFASEDSAGGPDTVLGYWQGRDRIALQWETGLAGSTLPTVQWVDDRGVQQFQGTDWQGEGAAAIILSHWNGSSYDGQQHLWVDWDGQGGAQAQHMASIIGSQQLQAEDFLVLVGQAAREDALL